MNIEPKGAYRFQPLPAIGERIYGVSGPGSEVCRGLVFTKDEADRLVHCINTGGDPAIILKIMSRERQP